MDSIVKNAILVNLGFGFNKISSPKTITDDGFMTPRPFQKRFLDEISDSDHGILNGPTACGKTLGILYLVGRSLRNNKNRIAIISVPQTIIAQGFTCKNNIEYPDGHRMELSPHDITSENILDSKVKELINTLQLASEGIYSQDPDARILVCTHSTLVRAFERKKKLFKNIDIVIDEAHHVQYDREDESDEDSFSEESESDKEITNKLGAICQYGLSHPQNNLRFILSTATYFRTDRLSIVPEKYESSFKKVYVSYSEYFQICKNLLGFSFDFYFYHHMTSYIEGIHNLFYSYDPEKMNKFIIHIPHRGSREALEDKSNEVARICGNVVLCENPEISYDKETGITTVKNRQSGLTRKIIDFVSEEDRDIKKKTVEQAHNHVDSSIIDGIIALGMLKEGANWKWAVHSVIAGFRNSIGEVMQIVGRVLRDASGKQKVHVHYVVRGGSDVKNEEYSYEANRYMKGISGIMCMMQVVFNANKKIRSIGGKEIKMEENDQFTIMEDIGLTQESIQTIIDIRHEGFESGKKFTLEERKALFIERMIDVVKDRIQELNLKCDPQEACEILFFNMQKASKVQKDSKDSDIFKLDTGTNVDDIDYDLIEKEDELGGIFNVGSKFINSERLDDFCSSFGKSKDFLPYEEAKEHIRSLNFKNVYEHETWAKSEKRPKNIPYCPHEVYQEKWTGWSEYLGSNNNRNFLPYEEVKNLVISLNIKSSTEYINWLNKTYDKNDIPLHPYRTYKEQWKSWGDFLNTGYIANQNRNYKTYNEAKEYLSKYKLKSGNHFRELCRKKYFTDDIPKDPPAVYGDNFIGWGDFLSTGNIAPSNCKYMSFENLKNIISPFNFKNAKEYRNWLKNTYCKKDIPSVPEKIYDEWISWGDFLGNGNIAPSFRKYKSFNEAREYIRSLNFKNQKEYFKWSKSTREKDIPSNPQKVYSKEWVNWKNYLHP